MTSLDMSVWQWPANSGHWWARCPHCNRDLGHQGTYAIALNQLIDHINRRHPEHAQ